MTNEPIKRNFAASLPLPLAAAWIFANVVVLLLVAYFAFGYGLQMRRWTWDQTEGAHLSLTLDNAIKWGHNANEFGMQQVYEKLVAEDGEQGVDGKFRGTADMHGDLPLDYPPLRLYIMSCWEKWTQKKFPTDQPHWRSEYEFTRPMLEVNAYCELAGAVMMFVLVYYWLGKCRPIEPQPWVNPVRGAWPAMLSALLVWFNPATIFDSNGYVQWDSWLLAPFLLAIFLALIDQWLLAGICIGIVSLCKGQVLLVLPAIVVWQLCSLRPKWGIRIALCAGALATLWMAYVRLLPLEWLYVPTALVLAPVLFHLLYPWTWQRLLIGGGVFLSFVVALVICWKSYLAVVPICLASIAFFITWLIVMNHTASLVRFAVGLMLAVGFIASPWMVSSQLSLSWIVTVVLAMQLLLSLQFNRKWTVRNVCLHGFAILLCLQLVLWPWLESIVPDSFWPVGWLKAPGYFWYALLATVVLIAGARFFPLRFATAWFCAGTTAALFACVPLFHTSMDWYTVGIKASTDQHHVLGWCFPVNLSAILERPDSWGLSDISGRHYDWTWGEQLNLADYIPFLAQTRSTHRGFQLSDLIPTPENTRPSPHPWEVPMRYVMMAAYLLGATLGGIGMAIQHRRRSPRFFFAMVAPWILMFTLLPQMQARYLMWAAVFSAAAASFSMEGFLLCLVLSIISVLDTALFLFQEDRSQLVPFTQKWEQLLVPMFPGLSWGVLLLAAIWLYLAIKPGRRTSEPARAAPVSPLPVLPVVT